MYYGAVFEIKKEIPDQVNIPDFLAQEDLFFEYGEPKDALTPLRVPESIRSSVGLAVALPLRGVRF